ncbi:MAG: hypothetical protein ACLTE2_06380 [Eubacteriales bacterium]
MFLLLLSSFYFARLAPGDPLESFYGDRVETMTPAELEAARARLGLDGPIWMQYIHWLSGVFQGDFGISLKYKNAGYASDSAADWQYINFGLNRLYSGIYACNFAGNGLCEV